MSKVQINITIASICETYKEATTKVAEFIKNLDADFIVDGVHMHGHHSGLGTGLVAAEAPAPAPTKSKKETKKQREAREKKEKDAAEFTEAGKDAVTTDDDDLGFTKTEVGSDEPAEVATVDDMRSAIRKYARENSTDATRELLSKSGYKKATDIPEDKIHDFITVKMGLNLADVRE